MKMILYSDGGVQSNPGNGAWAFVCPEPRYECAGAVEDTTNNRMEITGVLKAIEYALGCGASDITVFTDSQYVVKGFKTWSLAWERNNWMKKDGWEWVPVKNAELWKQLVKYRAKANVVWVRGHNGDEFNEVADKLVRAEYKKVFGGVMKH